MKKLVSSAVLALVATAALSACDVNTANTADNSSKSGGNGNGGNGGSGASSGPNYTTNQANALDSAQSYLDMGGGFSRQGLIDQLSSKAGEGFKVADATFAVDHIDVDWNEQAVLSAKGYLSMGGMSRQGLIDQLTSKAGEQFTVKQANYAADKVGLK